MEKEKKKNRKYFIMAIIITVITLVFLQLVITQTKKIFSTSLKNEEPCSIIINQEVQTIGIDRQYFS